MQITIRTILAISVVVIIFSTWFKPLDSTAIQQIDTGLNRALISYATARTLNAVISVAQGTEVSFEPGGVGLNFTPGQALDPINDLIEQFSSLMLAACVAFGVQKILISVGGFWLISLVLTTATLGWSWFYFRHIKPPAWITRILLVLLMVRFAIPVVTLGSDQMFQKFLSADYKESQQVIDAASSQVTELNQPEQPIQDEKGWFERMKEKTSGLWSQTKSAVNPKEHYLKLKQTAEQWAVHFIKLIVIFLLQTLIIPVILIWALYAVARGTFEVPVKIRQ
jgi:hypothetical protein